MLHFPRLGILCKHKTGLKICLFFTSLLYVSLQLMQLIISTIYYLFQVCGDICHICGDICHICGEVLHISGEVLHICGEVLHICGEIFHICDIFSFPLRLSKNLCLVHVLLFLLIPFFSALRNN